MLLNMKFQSNEWKTILHICFEAPVHPKDTLWRTTLYLSLPDPMNYHRF